MPDTQTTPADSQSDLDAIIAGMAQAPSQDRARAPLPAQVQPDYRIPMPTSLQPQQQPSLPNVWPPISPTTGQPMPTYGTHTPDGRYVTGPQGTVVQQPGELVPGSRPGQLPPELQPGQLPPQLDPRRPYQIASADPTQVAVAQPAGRYSLGNQPGPWPAANPNSPRYDPATAPALPGETPDETAALNRFMAHETGNRGNIINDWAAKNPALYYDPKNPRTCQGYWQMVNSTWLDGARRAGVDLNQFPTAMTADYQTQRRVALALYRSYGDRPWRAQPGAGELGDREHLRPQQPLPAEPRGYQDWGKDPPGGYTPASARDFGPGPQGQQQGQFGQPPQPGGLERVLNGIGPLLLGIASLALHLPLSTAITAYGAMARAQDNGQREAYERNRTRMQDAAKEAAAQQSMESRDASDAFVEYGNNNPQGLQQQLAQIALKYNDPVMYRMAERGDLNGIHQLQQQRDLYNQDLLKGNRAAQEEQDRQAQNRAVQAMDDKWRQEHPNASQADFDIAHNEHIGEAARAGTKTTSAGTGEEAKVYNVVDKDTGKPTGKQVRVGKNGGTFDLNGQPTQLAPNEKLGDEAGVKSTQDKPEQEGEVRNVLGPDGKPTGQQVREGKTGGYFDPDSGERVHLKPGETIQQPGRGAADTLEPTKPYDVLKDGKVVRTVLARERKDRPGFVDAQSGDEIKLGEGEALQPHQKPANDSLEVSKPYDIVDDKGHIVKPNVMLRERKDQAGYVHSETGDPLVLEKGQSVKQITPTTSGGGRAGAQVLRQLVGGREVLSDLENAVRLPVGTTTGPLGSVHPGPSVRDALIGDLTRKLTDQDSQLMQASMASMERELSVLMSPVYGGNWAAQQISPLIPKSGDTIQTVIFKLARLAQSADNALEAASKSPILSNEEQQYANDLRSKIKEAIPWSSGDAMDFVYRGRPKESFGAYVQRQGIGQDRGGQPKSSLPPGVTVEVK